MAALRRYVIEWGFCGKALDKYLNVQTLLRDVPVIIVNVKCLNNSVHGDNLPRSQCVR